MSLKKETITIFDDGIYTEAKLEDVKSFTPVLIKEWQIETVLRGGTYGLYSYDSDTVPEVCDTKQRCLEYCNDLTTLLTMISKKVVNEFINDLRLNR